MEILSLGQKLKRARVYMGYTLKDICEDKISVSKLSCIENDKIKPEPWVLKHICDKLKLTIEYLSQDVEEQIISQIDELSETNDNYIEQLEYYFEIAMEKKYIHLSYKIIQLIFSYYMKNNNLLKCHDLTPKYYNIAIKVDKSIYVYYLDMGEFIFKNKEYNEAHGYFNNVIMILKEKFIDDSSSYFKALYNKIICLLHLKRYSEAIELLTDINQCKNLDLQKNDMILLHILAAILVLLNTKEIKEFEVMENKVYALAKEDVNLLINFKYNVANLLFLIGYYSQALIYIEELNNILLMNKINAPLKESLLYIDLLIKNSIPENALNICDGLLNLAIQNQDNENIEKLYYHKGRILNYMGNFVSAEVYYNLSLDLLTKTDKKEETSKRYFEIGCLYYKMNNTKDAIKYINTSISIKSKI